MSQAETANTTSLSRRLFLATTGMAASGVLVGAPCAIASNSDLAETCLRESTRWQWLNDDANTVGMSDKDWGAEFERQDAVWVRAITEPSASLRDLAAKAEMLQREFARLHPEADYTTDDYRLLRVVLREITEMGGLA